ncbi:MAG: YegP family protein [Verrucomicrobiales bacterium]|nr:YegP family protein [Verrucomicrobiales bacterium]
MFEITKTKAGKFHFHLKAKNHQIILTSQSYKDLASAKKGARSVAKSAAKNTNFNIATARNGKLDFNLLAANKQIVGTSQMYTAKRSAQKGIASVQANAPGATIEVTTVKKLK